LHLLTTYALNCGAKIGKPFIYTSFFPIPFERYVTFHTDCVGNARNYDYWQDVINIIAPILSKNNIRILQVGGPKDREYSECVSLKGQTNMNQLAYVVKNSMLHFGPDSFAIHLAGTFDIPLVSLYSTNFVNCVKPYFGSPEKQVFISSYDRAGLKPSFSNEENPKTINLIKPEEIASAIFKLLGIDFTIPFDSVFFGKKYSNFSIQELYLNQKNVVFNPELQVEIRADNEFYSDEALFNQLSRYKRSIIIMDKPINLNILSQFKANIMACVLKVTETDHTEFLSKLEALGIKIILVSELSEKEIAALKFKYYEFGIVNRIEQTSEDKINELKKDIDSLYYRSAKITASNGKFYYSNAAVEKDVPMNNHYEYQKVIDTPSFWKNVEFCTIIKRK